MSDRKSDLRSFDRRLRQSRAEREESGQLIFNDFDDEQGILDYRNLFTETAPDDARPNPMQLDAIASSGSDQHDDGTIEPPSVAPPVRFIDSTGEPPAVENSGSSTAVQDSGSRQQPASTGPDVDAFAKNLRQAAQHGPLSDGNLMDYQGMDWMESQYHIRPVRVKQRGKKEISC